MAETDEMNCAGMEPGNPVLQCLCCFLRLQSITEYQEHLITFHKMESPVAERFVTKRLIIEKVFNSSGTLLCNSCSGPLDGREMDQDTAFPTIPTTSYEEANTSSIISSLGIEADTTEMTCLYQGHGARNMSIKSEVVQNPNPTTWGRQIRGSTSNGQNLDVRTMKNARFQEKLKDATTPTYKSVKSQKRFSATAQRHEGHEYDVVILSGKIHFSCLACDNNCDTFLLFKEHTAFEHPELVPKYPLTFEYVKPWTPPEFERLGLRYQTMVLCGKLYFQCIDCPDFFKLWKQFKKHCIESHGAQPTKSEKKRKLEEEESGVVHKNIKTEIQDGVGESQPQF